MLNVLIRKWKLYLYPLLALSDIKKPYILHCIHNTYDIYLYNGMNVRNVKKHLRATNTNCQQGFKFISTPDNHEDIRVLGETH